MRLIDADALKESMRGKFFDSVEEWTAIREIDEAPTIEPTEITYQNCADALLKMWMDNVLTDAEYNRIMDKLNNAQRKDEPLCRTCDYYAGDGMYCAKNIIVYDFSRACKYWDEDADGELERPHQEAKRTMTEEHKKHISDAVKRKWKERKESE